MTEPKKTIIPKKPLNNWIKYSGMGIQMAAIITGGTLGGIEIDKKLNLKFPVFTLSLTLLSVFLAIYYFIKDVLKK